VHIAHKGNKHHMGCEAPLAR